MHPARPRGPWRILCDNEHFLDAAPSREAYRRAHVSLWHTPKKSPDFNPVEKYWGWLRKRLREKDLADLVAKRRPVQKTALKARVRAICRSLRGQRVAASYFAGLRSTCQCVIKNKGAAIRG